MRASFLPEIYLSIYLSISCLPAPARAGRAVCKLRRWTICTLGRPALRHKPAAGCQCCRAACPPPCARSCGSSCGSKTSRVCADEVCKLYYRGDENYGLGNVLYDVASAAAIAMVLNRSIVYSANSSDQGGGGLAAVGAVRVAL